MRLPKRPFPSGDLRSIYLHWTAGDYATTFDAYHFCVAREASSGLPVVHATHDLQANMRDVRTDGAPYAAHTAGRNSFAAGIAICAMAGAVPGDFGAYPLREELVLAACELAAELCNAYGIPPAAVRTHAEAALEDGYFGAAPDERWDIARLAPAPGPLTPLEAVATGDALRGRVGEALRRLGLPAGALGPSARSGRAERSR
jgi:hypothetical protein